jgi:hypothetical protein
MRTGQRQVALDGSGESNAKPFNGTNAVLRSQGMEIMPTHGYLRSLG